MGKQTKNLCKCKLCFYFFRTSFPNERCRSPYPSSSICIHSQPIWLVNVKGLWGGRGGGWKDRQFIQCLTPLQWLLRCWWSCFMLLKCSGSPLRQIGWDHQDHKKTKKCVLKEQDYKVQGKGKSANQFCPEQNSALRGFHWLPLYCTLCGCVAQFTPSSFFSFLCFPLGSWGCGSCFVVKSASIHPISLPACQPPASPIIPYQRPLSAIVVFHHLQQTRPAWLFFFFVFVWGVYDSLKVCVCVCVCVCLEPLWHFLFVVPTIAYLDVILFVHAWCCNGSVYCVCASAHRNESGIRLMILTLPLSCPNLQWIYQHCIQ